MGIPVVEVYVRFQFPSPCAETLDVESAVTESGRSRFTANHRFLRGKEHAVEIAEKRVWSARAAPARWNRKQRRRQ